MSTFVSCNNNNITIIHQDNSRSTFISCNNNTIVNQHLKTDQKRTQFANTRGSECGKPKGKNLTTKLKRRLTYSKTFKKIMIALEWSSFKCKSRCCSNEYSN